MLAYLLIFPSFLVLRLRRRSLERPFRVPGGMPVAWAVTVLTMGWSIVAAVCLLWPGLGTAVPDDALPAGFDGDRLQFELLVLGPIVVVVFVALVFHLRSARTR